MDEIPSWFLKGISFDCDWNILEHTYVLRCSFLDCFTARQKFSYGELFELDNLPDKQILILETWILFKQEVSCLF